MSGDGKPQLASDMAAQLALSLDNLEAILGEAGMSLATSSGPTPTPPTSICFSSPITNFLL
jgi:hypothetical protein